MPRNVAGRIAEVAERISSLLGPRGMRYVARFMARLNNLVVNPTQRLWAPHLHHMAIIEHRGRRSGKRYQTPVMAFIDGEDFVVVLNYGTGSDWVRNVEEAGSAEILHRRWRYRLTNPRVIPIGSAELPTGLRAARTPGRSALHATLISA
jgi:deazaflavin-dependent oxidoreductase (nitroreductase family)